MKNLKPNQYIIIKIDIDKPLNYIIKHRNKKVLLNKIDSFYPDKPIEWIEVNSIDVNSINILLDELKTKYKNAMIYFYDVYKNIDGCVGRCTFDMNDNDNNIETYAKMRLHLLGCDFDLPIWHYDYFLNEL